MAPSTVGAVAGFASGAARDEGVSLGKQIGIVLLILLAVIGGGYWYASDPAGSSDADAATKPKRDLAIVDIAPVERRTLAQNIEAVGTTLARQAVDIKPAASGRVVELAFSPGSLVEAESLLVRLDDGAERADVAEAEAERRKAGLELERAIKLVAKKTIAQATVEALEAAYNAADARLLRAEKALNDREIQAPFKGRTGLKQVNIGARVDEGTVITTLDDLAEIEVEFSVPEVFFGAVRAGQPIKATGVAFGDRRFEGSIQTVDSRIDRVSRAFKVRATIPNPDLTLPAGMFMLVSLTLGEHDALTVPEEAVMVDGDESFVFVILDEKADRRLVTLGQREFGLVEIVDGLDDGEQVVVRGIQRVKAGANVEVRTETRDKEVPEHNGPPAAGEPSA